MKKEQDPGLKYMIALGIQPPRDTQGLYRQFEQKFGMADGRARLGGLFRLIAEKDGNPDYLKQFYDLKNADLETSLLFSGGFDGDSDRKAINWIVQNSGYFGKTILDVGCDCGIMTVFLAMAFPESQITAADRSANAVASAKQLAEKMDVSNITFLNADVSELDQQFDTVFAMRTLQDNCDTDQVLAGYNLLKKEAASFGENIGPFAEALEKLVKPEGYLVSIERCDIDPIFLGWMSKLHELGFTMDDLTYNELICREMEQEAHLQAMFFQKAPSDDEDMVYRFWCVQQAKDLSKSTDNQYQGWSADMVLQNFHEDLVYGYYINDPNGVPLLTYSVWTYRKNPRLLLLYQAMGDERLLTVYSAEHRDYLVDEIRKMKEEYVRQGTTAVELGLENDEIVIR